MAFCSSDESPPTHIRSSKNAFIKVSPVGIQFTYSRPSETLFLLSGSQVLFWHHCHHVLASLDETVKTFAVFPSWLRLLNGEDNCMLSVPSSTRDLHINCWQGGDICQQVANDAFQVVQLRTVVFLQIRKISFLSSVAVLPTCYLLHDSRLLGLTLRPSDPVCCYRVSWTRGALSSIICPPFGSSCVGTCPVVSGCLWVTSLQVVLKCEGFAIA